MMRRPVQTFKSLLICGTLLLANNAFADEPSRHPSVAPINVERVKPQLVEAYALEQTRLAGLRKRNDPASALELARLNSKGILIQPGNPLRLQKREDAIALLLPHRSAANEFAVPIRLELAKLLLARAAVGDSALAVRLLEEAALAGDPRAKMELGLQLEAGITIPRDPARAKQLLEQAFNAGEIRAIDGLQRLAAPAPVEGPGANDARRLMLLAGRAEESSWAAATLALAFATGKGVPVDLARAADYAASAVRQGAPDAALQLHAQFLKRLDLDPALKAREASLLRDAALAGSAEAALALVTDFSALDRFGIDPTEARFWFDSLSEAGNGRAIFLYVRLLGDGRKLAAEAGRKEQLLTRLMAFARSHPEQALMLGRELTGENSPVRDRGLAIALFDIAATANVPDAARHLAEQVLFGASTSTSAETERALALLRKSDQQDDRQAGLLLARAYAEGRANAADPAAALAILDRLIGLQTEPKALIARGTLFATQGGADQPLALDDFRKAADLGAVEAMVELGRMFRSGRVIGKDTAEAVRWFEKAIAAGSVTAKRDLASLLLNPETGGPSTAESERALLLLREGFEAGDSQSALLYGKELVARANDKEAADVYAKLAQTDVPLGKAALAGLKLKRGGLTEASRLIREAASTVDQRPFVLEFVAEEMLSFPDPQIAKNGAALLADAAARGEARAALALSKAHLAGKGVPRDLDAAERYAERAAALGQSSAFRDLGHAFATADGVPRDEARARAIRERASRAEPDNAHARYDLARMLLDGDGGPRDPERGGEELLAAVRLGHLGAQMRLARQIVDGDTRLGTSTEAVQLLEDAARRGALDAPLELGRLLSSGDLGFVDQDRARLWYQRAAEQGSVEARLERAREPLSGLLDARDEQAGLTMLADLGREGIGEADAERARYLLATASGVEAESRQRAGIEALHKAAQAGEAEAMFQLSTFYQRGYLVPQDNALARTWLERAAKAGHAFSRSLVAGETDDSPIDDTAPEPNAAPAKEP